MTYHSAKGLQFEAIFMPKLEDFDDSQQKSLYVAATRTYKYLYMMWSDYEPDFLSNIPKELYEEFADGWVHGEEWDNHTEPFAEYYEHFAAEHADKIIHASKSMRVLNYILKHWLLFAIVTGLLVTFIMVKISELWVEFIK
jgi:hypothetical protein